MKFALALLAVTAVQAASIETATELEKHHTTMKDSGMMDDDEGDRTVRTIRRVYSTPTYTKKYYYNGHGHHSDSDDDDDDEDDDDSYCSSDYSDEDYGYGYRYKYGRHRYYRYTPKYYGNRWYYGSRYASRGGHYRGVYRTYSTRSYTTCNGCYSRTVYYRKH